MDPSSYYIDPDIRKAHTLPGSFYASREIFSRMAEEMFPRCWQWLGVTRAVPEPGTVFPVNLLPEFLDEPVLLVRDQEGEIGCLSNICTHRANLLVRKAGPCSKIKCNYHGRRFALNGKLEAAPGFEGAENFPGEGDHLRNLPVGQIGNFVFTRLAKGPDFSHWKESIDEKMGRFSYDRLLLDSGRSKTYEFNAHWALYVENYLEGFHIPFVHKALNAELEMPKYDTELFDWGVVQTAITSPDKPFFRFPEGHPEHGSPVGAYYIWLFPNIMFNFYPWGISLNIVRPKGLEKTEVQFLTYVMHPELLNQGPGSGLDRVELEDEEIVQQVQKGVRSRFYSRGRFSPKHERGVHHFQQLLLQELGLSGTEIE